MNRYTHLLYDHFLELGVSETGAKYLNMAGLLLLLVLVVWLLGGLA